LKKGVGLFEVDRELAQIAKQRIIDSGVGSDLICLGQQPRHAVPLLKYVHRPGDAVSRSKGEDYKCVLSSGHSSEVFRFYRIRLKANFEPMKKSIF